MAERVIDGLEVVEISNHDSAERAASHLQTNALLERTTVQRVREWIVERGPAQLVVRDAELGLCVVHLALGVFH